MNWLLATLLCICLVEIALRLPFSEALFAVTRSSQRAARVVTSKRISDHWKEKAMGAYARATFIGSLKLAGLIVAVFGPAAVLVLLAQAAGARGFSSFLFTAAGIGFTLVFACLYAWIRMQQRPRTEKADQAYSRLDKLLHRLALGSRPVAEMSFDMDQKMVAPDTAATAAGRHVFVSGLARAGTTVLMRRFHASGDFRSLTYRDMPFVLAPNFWKKIGGSSKIDTAAGERAHGDNLEVDADSPESLDEVFWRVFAGEEYIDKGVLVPHEPDAETRDRFVSYVGAILARSGRSRYLSKNNNNILRLPAIRAAFPNALILVPFRAPRAHAGSLLSQHRNFIKMQDDDPFVRRYMSWLAHHEFGRDHRPFRFGDKGPEGDPDTLDYWLALWTRTYEWLLETAPADADFVSYEALCSDPGVWQDLAERAGIDPGIDADGGFRLSSKPTGAPSDPNLAARADALHARLEARGRQDLGRP